MPGPELLSPAGSLKSLRYAFAYGADAVYAGLPRYGLRVRNNEFKKDNLGIGIREAHAAGKLFYLTANVMPHNDKVRTFLRDLEPIVALGPDALIMADPGLIMLVRERWPEMPIHLSVQANTLNYASVQFWQSLGVARIILSRELSLKEIEEIRERCPGIELEVFVHGALCIAYSGRCLLSGYLNHREANQGTCTNACRWEYQLLEETRPGQPMLITEDENGSYILNSKDLRAVEHVARLVDIGIDCLKIEGRTKSHYYVARTAQVYRQAIDDARAGRPFEPELIGVLENLANRGYTDGFFQRHRSHEYQNYLQGASRSHRQQFVGEVVRLDGEYAEIEVKNRFSVGDRLEVITPEGNRDLVLERLEDLEGAAIGAAPGSGYYVRLPRSKVNSEKGLIARYL